MYVVWNKSGQKHGRIDKRVPIKIPAFFFIVYSYPSPTDDAFCKAAHVWKSPGKNGHSYYFYVTAGKKSGSPTDVNVNWRRIVRRNLPSLHDPIWDRYDGGGEGNNWSPCKLVLIFLMTHANRRTPSKRPSAWLDLPKKSTDHLTSSSFLQFRSRV